MDGAAGSSSPPREETISLYMRRPPGSDKNSAGPLLKRDEGEGDDGSLPKAEATERSGLMQGDSAVNDAEKPEVAPPSYEDAIKTFSEPPEHPDTRRRQEDERGDRRSLTLAYDPIPLSERRTTQTTYDPESQREHPTASSQSSGPGLGRAFAGLWEQLQRRFKLLRSRRNRIIILSCIIGLLLLLFLILFPISFVKVEYNEIALLKTRSTGYVYKTPTYYSGCYVMGPNSELIRFPSTAQIVEYEHLEIFAEDGLAVDITITLIYYLRGEELGLLFDTYDRGYEDVLDKVAQASIKNTATEFTVNSLRLNRQGFEQRLHSEVQRALGGTCCPAACEVCVCHPGPNCTRGLHVDVRQLMLSEIRIPQDILSRYLTSLILTEAVEELQLKQEEIITNKETERQVLEIENSAREILANATAQGLKIQHEAQALVDQTVQSAIFNGWKRLCDRLDLTNQDHRLSALFIKSLHEKDNLQTSVGFNSLTKFAGHRRHMIMRH